ncbi:hypothetical protein BJ875DRAFT_500010 [Amylocarpus encephaloides]|uniref:DUF6536 domain-containing protein n=1 Tax=Amylocarpus encephaloides TaxID=45428 RepID=A0A9P8C0F8_9HELO|nr:hypothetical protein BJ875DRAFT_500010 [Amylocarpus encephaloides]
MSDAPEAEKQVLGNDGPSRLYRCYNYLKNLHETLGAQFSKIQDIATVWIDAHPIVIWYRDIFPGCEGGVVIGIGISLLAFLANLAFFIWATQRNKPSHNGLGTIAEGDCKDMISRNRLAHVFINIISTLLLMQSNSCMQLLASPTRGSVDFAHKRRKWVDIGIPSFRNVWARHISIGRSILWLILGVSSAVLHLLWNSTVIFSPSAFRYNQLAVTEGFVHGLPFINGNEYVISEEDQTLWPDNLHFLQRDLSMYERLENAECKQNYATSFIRDRSDVIVVTAPKSPENKTSTILGSSSGGFGPWPYKWLCPKDLTQNFGCYDQLEATKEIWTFPNFNYPTVLYCLSKKMKQQCKLEYGFYISLFTILANFAKLLVFAITLWTLRSHRTKELVSGNAKENKNKTTLLVTTGDALASFLEVPDSKTLGMSTVEKEDFRNGIWKARWEEINAMEWRDRSKCAWFRAIGLNRWLAGNLLLLSLAVVPGIYLLSKFQWLKGDLEISYSTVRKLGIGNPSGLFLFGPKNSGSQLGKWSVLRKVAFANSPQLAVSTAYYFWNSHLTAMIAAREYDVYAAPVKKDGSIGQEIQQRQKQEKRFKKAQEKKQGLRVTNPIKMTKQRSTHLLTLPIKYWIVNTPLWSGLHYLASQTVFFARVDILDHWLETTEWSISQVGYSILGLILFFSISLVILCYAFGVSIQKMPNRMPLAATCSAALSAACHPRDAGENHHEKEVHWGVEVVKGWEGYEEYERCTFTSGSANYPEEDTSYA